MISTSITPFMTYSRQSVKWTGGWVHCRGTEGQWSGSASRQVWSVTTSSSWGDSVWGHLDPAATDALLEVADLIAPSHDRRARIAIRGPHSTRGEAGPSLLEATDSSDPPGHALETASSQRAPPAIAAVNSGISTRGRDGMRRGRAGGGSGCHRHRRPEPTEGDREAGAA
jgi:hypothetical protein